MTYATTIMYDNVTLHSNLKLGNSKGQYKAFITTTLLIKNIKRDEYT